MKLPGSRFSILYLGLTRMAVSLALLGAVLGMLGDRHWFLELFSHFRLQYAVTLAIGALVFSVARRFRWAITSATAAALLGAALLPFCFPRGAAPGSEDFKVISFNLLSSNENYEEVLAFIRREEADLVFLMEVNRAWNNALGEMAGLYPHRLSEIREDNFGVILLSKVPLIDPEIAIFGPVPVPTIRTRLAVGGHEFQFIGTHPLPPVGRSGSDARNRQLRELAAMISAEPTGALILAGDLNITPFSPHFRSFIATSKLRDSAQGHGYATTWMPGSPVFALPLDHILLTHHFLACERRVGPSCGSDHRPVIAILGFTE